jgi:tetratricopeptide (TPR) repeat protein
MTVETPRIRSLLRQANRTESAGKRAAAEQLYRQALDEAPESVGAWLGLARVVKDKDQRDEAYLRVLVLDPGNEIAQEALNPTEYSDIPVKADGAIARNQGSSKENSPLIETATETAPSMEETYADGRTLGEDFPGMPVVDEVNDLKIEDAIHSHDIVSEQEVLYCANHPSRETHLRCNRCGKPMCSSCAQPTPVGYRCKQCIREHEDIYYSATAIDYVVAVVISLPLAFAAGYIASLIGFFAIFLAAVVGSFLGRVVFRATGRRRGRGIPQIVAAAVVLGAILPLILRVLSGNILSALFLGIYIVAASGAAYYQMR